MTRRNRIFVVGVVLAVGFGFYFYPTVSAAANDDAAKNALKNPFFALCVSTHDAQYRTPAQQAKLLKELGYDGMAHVWVKGAPQAIKAADDAGITLFQIYVKVSLDPKKPKYNPALKELIQSLKGRKTMLALLISGGKPSDESLDPRAVEIVREIADMAEPAGVKVALYPHTNDWLERVEDAVRIAKKADRKNVGAMINLCHWLKVDDEKNMTPLLKQAVPHLFAVTINGADSNSRGGGWDRLIQPLHRGTFDMSKFVKTLHELGYTGPVGLQCFGIKGDVRDNLKQSIEAWRKMSAAAGK